MGSGHKKNKNLTFGGARHLQVGMIGILVYAVMAILSQVFYKERCIFMDISFHLFYILKDGDFAIQNFRFGAILTQVFPLVGAKLGLSLTAIMRLYSLAFVILPFSIFGFITFYLKNWRMGLVTMLFSILMVTHTFFWIQSEFGQGILIMTLYFSLLIHFENKDSATKIWHYTAHTILLFSLVFVHPLLVFPFLFVAIYLYLINQLYLTTVIGVILSFSTLYLLKFYFFRTSYDVGALSGMQNFASLFPDYLHIASNRRFLEYLIKDYYMIPLISLLVFSKYSKDKALIKGLFLIASLLGYTLLINVSYVQEVPQFYIENFYLPLSLMVIFPLVFEVWPKLSDRIFWTSMIIILVIRIIHICMAHDPYTVRLDWMRGYMESTDSKLIVSDDKVPLDTLMMTWASPYEFWLLSEIETGNTRSIVIDQNPEIHRWASDKKNVFITKWGYFPYAELPKRYLTFKDSTAYEFIE